jgi:DNA-binding XRE family transcriptional regulator
MASRRKIPRLPDDCLAVVEVIGSDGERWRPVPVPGYGEHYEVSDLGRVRHLRARTGRLRRPSLKSAGHPCVSLSAGGRVTVVHLASLVAAAYLPPRPPGAVVKHRDGDPANCRADNLQWGHPGPGGAATPHPGDDAPPGLRLRALRCELGYTIGRAAGRAGISRAYWSMIESGDRRCDPPLFGRLAAALAPQPED